MTFGPSIRPRPLAKVWASLLKLARGAVLISTATTVIPQNPYANQIARRSSHQSPSTTNSASYDDAAAMCRAKVDKIIKECRRINKKYRDPHFDIEADLKLGIRDCLQSLSNVAIKGYSPRGGDFKPQSAKRVVDIFDRPKFYIDGPTANDVRQGRDGDCWLMAALCTLSNKKGLIEKLCVAHDQDVGVYGFVFHRDGEWISEIVDDFLYLTKPDYDESYLDRVLFDELERINPEEAYRKIYQTNSSSLYFAQCQHPQETWLPLLEKSYAKAHGDFAAIEGGFGGEGIEDLTGGVTSELFVNDVLDKEYFWTQELLRVNEDFLFGCSTGVWGLNRLDTAGIVDRHAYSIQKAVEIDGQRLLRLKNPWGKGEWKGPWSDGSKEWTPEWLEKLGHRFGDDGDFWIAYEDLLRKFQAFDRTRLFDAEWRVVQVWTNLSVPWTLDYHDTHFVFSLKESGPVVLVLSQLDDRYFKGLEGQYHFELAFRLHQAGHEDYLVRSQTPYRMRRSVNVELQLAEGDYQVVVKVQAHRLKEYKPIEQVIRDNIKDRRDKLVRTGLAYDLAHSKGKFFETPEERAAREKREISDLHAKRSAAKEKILSSREQAHYLRLKSLARERKKSIKKKIKRHQKEVKGRKGEEEASLGGSKNTRFTDETEDLVNGDYESHSEDDVESITSLSELSDRELDMHIDSYLNGTMPPNTEDPKDTPYSQQEEPDEFERDPWNASVVVGLRVYHKVPGGKPGEDIVRLKVVRPSLLAQSEGDGGFEERKPVATGLDVDDSAKDATMEGGVVERKMSILGDQKKEAR